MQNIAGFLCVLVLLSGACAQSRSCESLGQLALPQAKVVSAQAIAAGAFPPPVSRSPRLAATASLFKTLPAFCRVVLQGRPSADSDIKIEVWMPASGWDGRFHGQGNGGFAGEIDYRGMAIALSHGSATAGTDTGHSASGIDATWAAYAGSLARFESSKGSACSL